MRLRELALLCLLPSLALAQAARRGGGTAGLERFDDVTAQLLSKNLLLTESQAHGRDAPQAVTIYRNVGLTNDPMFAVGNPYVAGVGLEAMGVWYADDTTGGWKLFLSWEKSGTFASVLDGVRRSANESFLNHGDHKPFHRIEASSQALQLGAGGFLVAPGGAVRSSGTLTLTTATVGGSQQLHKMGVGQQLYKEAVPLTGSEGDTTNFGANGANWGAASSTMTVASVVDEHTITVTDARGDATNTEWLSFSAEPAGDVEYGRGSYGVAEIRTKGGNRLLLTETGPVVPDGLSLLSAGDELPLGANGTAPAEVTSSTLHVKEGYTFYNEGRYRSTGWYNGGGETQSTQEVFIVGTGSDNKTTNLPANPPDWTRLLIKNAGEGASHTLTIDADGSHTIDGSTTITIPANAAATLVSVGGDWFVWYHPAPP